MTSTATAKRKLSQMTGIINDPARARAIAHDQRRPGLLGYWHNRRFQAVMTMYCHDLATDRWVIELDMYETGSHADTGRWLTPDGCTLDDATVQAQAAAEEYVGHIPDKA